MGSFKKPLTVDDLRAVQLRAGRQADTRALLWEIKRLRSVVLRADQLQRALGNLGGGPGKVLDALRQVLADEPCVLEQKLLPELSRGAKSTAGDALPPQVDIKD